MADARIPDDDVSCNEQVELVTDYLEGVLPAAAVRRFEAHLENCSGCAEYLAQTRGLAGGLGDLREESIPSGMRDEIVAALRALRSGANSS